MVRFLVSTLWIASVLLANGEEKRFAYEMPLMGTMWRVVLYAPGDQEAKAKAAAEAAFRRVSALNLVMSDYRPDSEVRQLGVDPEKVSDDLCDVLTKSFRLSEESDGAFDVTTGALTRIWRRAFRRVEVPSASVLQEALRHTGWKGVKIDRSRKWVSLASEQMRIDLGGIGKGFALDEAMEVLRKDHGFARAFIDAGGDVLAGDPPPGEGAWTVAVRGNGQEFFLAVENEAVATSGDLHQGKTIDGVRYSHLIDPRDGNALRNGAAATVVARDAWLADGLASAACILVPSEIEHLIEKKKAAARVTRRLLSGDIRIQDVGGLSPTTPR